MVKTEADAILELAKQLLQEDVSLETRVRIARKILEHARAIKAVCMAEPAIKYGGNRHAGSVNGSAPAPIQPESPVIFEPVCYSYEFGTGIPQSIWDGIKVAYLNGRRVWPPIQPTPDHS